MADDQQLAGMQHSGGVGASDLLSLVASEERRRARARAAESAAEAALADLPSTQGGGEVAPPQSVAPTVVYVDREGRSRPQPRHIKFPR